MRKGLAQAVEGLGGVQEVPFPPCLGEGSAYCSAASWASPSGRRLEPSSLRTIASRRRSPARAKVAEAWR